MSKKNESVEIEKTIEKLTGLLHAREEEVAQLTNQLEVTRHNEAVLRDTIVKWVVRLADRNF